MGRFSFMNNSISNERGNMLVINMTVILIGMIIMLVMYSFFTIYMGKRHGDTAADAATLQAAKILQEKYTEELEKKKKKVVDDFWQIVVQVSYLQSAIEYDARIRQAICVLLCETFEGFTISHSSACFWFRSNFSDGNLNSYPTLYDMTYSWNEDKARNWFVKDKFEARDNGQLLVDTFTKYKDEILQGAKEYAKKNNVETVKIYFPLEGQSKIAVEAVQPLYYPMFDELIPAQSKSIKGIAGSKITIKLNNTELPINISSHVCGEYQ